MPVNLRKDNQGCYAIWGEQGAKYYYRCNDNQAKSIAKNKAKKQGQAIKNKEK